MTRKMGSEKARRNFSELLDQTYKGEITVITKHGRPYAMLVPPDQIHHANSEIGFTCLKGSGSGFWGNPDEYIQSVRDEWE